MTPAQHYVHATSCKEHDAPQREARFCVDCKDARIASIATELRELRAALRNICDPAIDIGDAWGFAEEALGNHSVTLKGSK